MMRWWRLYIRVLYLQANVEYIGIGDISHFLELHIIKLYKKK